MSAKVVFSGKYANEAASFKIPALDAYEKAKNYLKQQVIWVCPSRGMIPTPVVMSFLAIQWPMNHFRTNMIACVGKEVGAAYNFLFTLALNAKLQRETFGEEYGSALAKAPFVLTTEEDNILPYDAVLKLLEAIYKCPDCGGEVAEAGWKCAMGHRGFDAVSGLYFVKTDPPVPMAFGIPGQDDFRPVSVKKAIRAKSVIEVNGIAMGCALWRKGLFRHVPNTKRRPWFKTTGEMTQDLWFCKRAKAEAGARFGVHCGVRVGHLNPDTGVMW